jgi:iron complex outermembrane receptor protein
MVKNYLLLGGSLLAIALPGGAAAQSAQTSPPASTPAVGDEVGPGVQDPAAVPAEDIVVTGVRGSLRAGIDAKRNAVQFVDSVVAEDIGKLPDTNVAESLQRVSGVQVTRGIGEGVSITIRGLRQNLTLLNGREIVDTQGRGSTGPDTLGSGSYGLLSSIPAELIARLDVTKQAGAEQIEGGVGGTVNIVLRRPLDVGKQLIAGSGQIGTNDRWGKASYRGSILFSDSFAGNSFGVLVNLVYAKRYVREDSFNSFSGYRSLTTAFNNNPSGVSANPNNDAFFGSRNDDFRYQRTDDVRERFGLNGSLQWRPTDTLDLYVESLWARTKSIRDRNWLSMPTSAVGSDYDHVVLSPNEVLIAGTIRAPLQTNYEYSTPKATYWTSAVGGTFENGPLKIFAEYSHSRATGVTTQSFARLSTGTAAANTTYPVVFDLTAGEVPSLAPPATLDLTNPANFVYIVSQDGISTARTTNNAGRLDLTYSFNSDLLRSLEFGGRVADIDLSNVQSSTNLSFRRTLAGVEGTVSVYRPGDFLNGLNVSLPTAWLAPNRSLYAQQAGCRILQAPTAAACTYGANTPNGTYTVTEKNWSVYGKANFGFDLGSIAVSGNIGLRYANTRTTSIGNLTRPGGVIEPITARVNDGIWLPSAVLKLDLSDELVARLGAARVSARPNTASLNNGLAVTNVPSASGGNPFLNPFTVDQVDGSIEWYFAPSALVSVGLFYKDVKSFTVTTVVNEVVPGINNGLPIPVTRITNGTGGSIKGLELLYQQPFTFLPAPFDGFGVAANYTYIESRTPLVDVTNGQKLPIEGLSKHNVNLIGYYEKGPVALRVAYNWRDRYFNAIGLNGAGVFFDSYSDLSASANLVISDNFDLELEGVNLLDSGLRRYAGVPEAIQSYAVSGRQFSLTARFKF